ncbi:MAG: cytochrome c biogenesis protein ResB [Bdellovibrionaceae bacterium]|nr:cytochrome c biogenesis protein ResB [Pseudobdellovibrionaceae bacterium]
MASLMVLIIWGTIVESRYDAKTAGKMVYQSWMMYTVMGLLIYNLVIVMVDRLPWKLNHYPFILVHIGIITLIYGGWVTQQYGLDGSLSVPNQKSSAVVTVHQTDFTIYATFDGEKYTKIYDKEFDFYNLSVSEEKPIKFNLDYGSDPSASDLRIVKYVPFARATQKVIKSVDPVAGASIKFQLSNGNIQEIETLTQQNKNKTTESTLGLLTMYLGYNQKVLGRKNPLANELYFNALDANLAEYALYNKNETKPYKRGKVKIGDVIPTRWMGLEVRVMDYLQFAKQDWQVIEMERPTPLTTEAIQVVFNGKSEWLLLNDTVKVFTDKVAYIMAYHNRLIPLDFKVHLDQFEITHYQGTSKAMEYASQVTVQNINSEQKIMSQLISMNEPMKYAGYTFYQASFEKNEKTGEPVASKFSDNREPGRWIKYFGSIIFSLGIVWLFYQRRKRRTAI